MSGELEAAGALTTAGLGAAALEGKAPGRAGDGACLNCGAALAGAFCGSCGQAAHPHRSLWHMIEEVLHGLFHFDTKAWRTLPMLAGRPGTLTRNYIYGKRARYISPLALFLFTIFLMFFVFAFVNVDVFHIDSPQDRAEVEAALTEQRDALRELEAETATAPDAARERALTRARAAVRILEGELARVEAAERAEGGARNAGQQSAPASGAAAEDDPLPTWQEQLSDAAKNGDITVGTPFPELNARILHSLENPDLALYKIQQAGYKFSFLLVPISLPFIWLLFVWKRGLTLYDHTVFVLYSLSFASLVFILVALVNDAPWLEWVGAVVLGLGMPAHMFFHLKGAYALGWWSAAWRTLLLIAFAFVSLMLFVLAIVFLGLGG